MSEPGRRRILRALVVWSLAGGLVVAGAVTAATAWLAHETAPFTSSLVDSGRTASANEDTEAVDRRDELVAELLRTAGVERAVPTGGGPHAEYGVRAVTVEVTMSKDATAADIAQVLRAAETHSRGVHRIFSTSRPVVTTVVLGEVRFTWAGGDAEAQSTALVALRDDDAVESATIALTRYATRAGSGILVAAPRVDPLAVQKVWEDRLRATFPAVEDWAFTG